MYLSITVDQIVYVNQPPLASLVVFWQASVKYGKMMPRTAGTFKTLKVRDYFLTIEENGIENNISIDSATTVGL